MLVLPQHILNNLGKDPFDELMHSSGEVYRKQPLRQTELVYIENNPYFIKKHFGITLKECLKNIFSGRKPIIGAKTEWEAIQALNQLGIKSTPLVGYGSKGYIPFRQQSFVLTDALQDIESLEDICKNWPVSPPSFSFKWKLIDEVARITRILHEAGWYHRDLYLCHFLWQADKNQMYLIDLHRCQQHHRFARRWQVKDLAALLFSSMKIGLTRQDCLRFLSVYTQMPVKQAVLQHRPLIDEVLKKAKQLYQKAYQEPVPQIWMRDKSQQLPSKIGPFEARLHLPEGVFHALLALRVLKKQRWVLQGYYQNQYAVIKIFKHKREFDREIKRYHALQKVDVNIPPLLHQGVYEDNHVLIYEFLSGAQPLACITPELLDTIATLHKAGLSQSDCHRDNFLQKDNTIYVLDAGGIVLTEGRALGESKSLHNLALLFAQWPAAEDANHLPLLSHYLTQRNWPNTTVVQNRFKHWVQKFRTKGRKRWLNKIFRNCTVIKSKHGFFKRYCINRDMVSLYTQTLCEYPEAYFHPKATFLKRGRSATVVRTQLGDDDLVIKRFNRKNIIKKLKRYVTTSKAARAWMMSHAMESIGIATPEPLAFIEKRFGIFRLQSYFVTAFTPGQRLDKFVETCDDEKQLHACADALMDLINALYASNCYHGDLKAQNFIWDGELLFILDTDAARFYENPKAFEKAHAQDWQRLLRNWEARHPFYQLLMTLKR